MAQKSMRDPSFDLLFSRIVMQAPSPIGLADA
jgi:hypothetical protein